jgi:hypothetical protein
MVNDESSLRSDVGAFAYPTFLHLSRAFKLPYREENAKESLPSTQWFK